MRLTNILVIFFLFISSASSEVILLSEIKYELRFSKDYFTKEERLKIANDITVIFDYSLTFKEVVRYNFILDRYSLKDQLCFLYPKDFRGYIDLIKENNKIVFILNDKGCGAYRKAIDLVIKYNKELTELEKLVERRVDGTFIGAPEEIVMDVVFPKEKLNYRGVKGYFMDSYRRKKYETGLSILDIRFVNFSDGNKYLCLFTRPCVMLRGKRIVTDTISFLLYKDNKWKINLNSSSDYDGSNEQYIRWIRGEE